MHPEDRVLVAVMTSPQDLIFARDEGWYRIPERHAPKGIHADYVAFYFGRAFAKKKWAIHYYCRNLGHELVLRRDLLPDEPDHPRAGERYYKVQLGPLEELDRPIISLHWRRVSFIHTTWDRFTDAEEINDLLLEGDPYVDRLFYALREVGLYPEHKGQVEEQGVAYQADLVIPCNEGVVAVVVGDRSGPPSALRLAPDNISSAPADCAAQISNLVAQQGGARSLYQADAD